MKPIYEMIYVTDKVRIDTNEFISYANQEQMILNMLTNKFSWT